MKLNIKGCSSYCEKHGIKNYVELANLFELSVIAIRILEQGIQIGYEAVKDIYNKLGEKSVLQIINFEEETLNGFKSKYLLVGNTLF